MSRELDGVGGEIHDHLAQAHGIAAKLRGHIRMHETEHLEALLLGGHRHQIRHGFHQGADIQLGGLQLELFGFDLGVVEDIVEDRKQVVGAAADGLGTPALAQVELTVQNQSDHSQDAVHGGSDFVAHIGQEVALGAVGGIGRIFGFA